MQVDFYQLGDASAEQVICQIAARVMGDGGRLLIVAADEAYLTRLDRILWDQGETAFLPHGIAGGADDPHQPILLSSSEDAPNLARNMLIADGEWRESALTYDRSFFLFGPDTLEQARLAWKLLAGREGVERRYWSRDGGRWTQKA
jgi:DNA polymerase-3 subunit chi